ncbi:MAG: hypothetical protein PHO26_02675 [Dehalococcoidia bacterium]|nr:hypothetical protein [Dehalococcoidia bacterium]MDD5493810.1 hypothetical protein [Dehalococcoidia bacterium]
MVLNSVAFDSIPAYLVARIPEISVFLSTILMFFAGDYIMELFLKKSLKKMNFVSRTIIFLLYALLVLPVLCTVCAVFLQNAVLYPYQSGIVLVLLASFLLVGMLLSLRYNMRVKLKL